PPLLHVGGGPRLCPVRAVQAHGPGDRSGAGLGRREVARLAISRRGHLARSVSDRGLGPGCRGETLRAARVKAPEPPGTASTPFGRGWHGLVVAKPRGPYDPTGVPDQLAAGPWLLLGDPDEVDRISRHLGVRR